MSANGELFHYDPPPGGGDSGSCLVHVAQGGVERRFPLGGTIEIGRRPDDRDVPPGTLAITDPTVSRRHCVITCGADGRCYIRDVSRNGTWLDGRRLVPNVEIEVRPGQRIRVGNEHAFRLERTVAANPGTGPASKGRRTFSLPDSRIATVLVGDIRDYAVVVRKVPAEFLQRAVVKVFRALEVVVEAHGGSVKEYQGDALFAVWEHPPQGPGAVAACGAALALRAEAERLAADRETWDVREFRLRMDWAVTTGMVSTLSFGRDRPTGLSMVGEPVVLAFRLEKMVTDETGPIIACRATRDLAAERFEFGDLGARSAKGFEEAVEAFALRGEVPREA